MSPHRGNRTAAYNSEGTGGAAYGKVKAPARQRPTPLTWRVFSGAGRSAAVPLFRGFAAISMPISALLRNSRGREVRDEP